MDNRPIGIFDSGLGGLTVLRELMELMPQESFVYFGDTARVPYGNKSPKIITRFSEEIAAFLYSQNVKAILIACYTASSLALDYLREKFRNIPVFGVIKDGARAAVQKTSCGKIGIIGTRATIKSRSFEEAITKISPHVTIFPKACPLFVPLIEEGFVKGKFIREMIHYYLDDLVAKGIDTLLLGCTHYPLIKDEISSVYNRSFNIIDCGRETALFLRSYLQKNALLSSTKEKGKLHIYVSDDPESFRLNANLFLGENVEEVGLVKTWEKGEVEDDKF